MSRALLCDKCGITFSELEDGYQSFTATTVRTDPNTGERKQIQQAMDACPSCALIPKHQFAKELEAAKADDALGQRIAKLEREVLDAPTTEPS